MFFKLYLQKPICCNLFIEEGGAFVLFYFLFEMHELIGAAVVVSLISFNPNLYLLVEYEWLVRSLGTLFIYLFSQCVATA